MNKPRKTKINPVLVATLTADGISQRDLANQQNCSQPTITDCVTIVKSNAQILKDYLSDRTNVLRFYQKKAFDFINLCYDSLISDLQSGNMTPQQKISAIQTSSILFGTIYDKERLETGKSTSNTAVLHKIMVEALDKV